MSCHYIVGNSLDILVSTNHPPPSNILMDVILNRMGSSLVVEIGGKPILVEVEVVDVPLYYNLLLGCSWFYTISIVSSSVFHMLQFPHERKIVTIDQLKYCIPHTTSSIKNNVPLVGDSKVTYNSVGVSLIKDSTLMGTFPLPSPNLTDLISLIDMISFMVPQCLRYLNPWFVPSLSELELFSDTIPLCPTEASYHYIQSTSSILDPPGPYLMVSYPHSFPSWLDSSSNPLLQMFPSVSSIPFDRTLGPYFPPLNSSLSSSPSSEHIIISNQMYKQGNKKSLWRKQCLGGRSPFIGHHVGIKPEDSIYLAGGKIPLERHTTRNDPRLGVVPIII
jgi:hypothetical protein